MIHSISLTSLIPGDIFIIFCKTLTFFNDMVKSISLKLYKSIHVHKGGGGGATAIVKIAGSVRVYLFK